MQIFLLYAATVAIWGSSWLVIKFQLGVVPPDLSIAYRFALSAVMLWIFCLLSGRSLRFGWRAHAFMAAQGLTLFCLNYNLFYWAEVFLPSGLVAIAFSTITVLNIINTGLFFRQRASGRVMLAAVFGLSGLTAVFWPEIAGFDASGKAALGLALSLIATYSASLGNMVSLKLKAQAVPVIEGNTIGMSYGALFSLAFAMLRGVPLVYDTRPSYTIALIALAFFATVVGFTCYLTLVRRIGADRAAYSSVLFPVVALSLSTFFENYHWTPAAILGVGLVLFGNVLVLAQRRDARQKAESSTTVSKAPAS